MERKLAAIFSTDVKGYSRLMGDDEEATIHTLKTYREVISGLIEQHHGRVVDSPGDNMLAEFASAVDAVKSAVAIQHELKTRNAELEAHRRMEFRIGLNVGDVITDEGRLYGDGVNIAARLEGLADPGGICLSEAVHMQVENKLDLAFSYQGEQPVKNIARPVRVYSVELDGEVPAPLVSREPLTALPLPDKPSIAVLPFTNMSNDPEQEYFSDGMTDDIITDLSKISGLFVIARNSTFTYKGHAVKVAEVGRELGVRYVLEGSTRKAGDRVRTNVQLIDATTGGHLWAERYDRAWQDLFALQDDITQQVVTALRVEVHEAELARVKRIPTNNLNAYDSWLRGSEYHSRQTKAGLTQARTWYERAVELDPEFAMAYAYLGWAYWAEWVWQFSQDPQTLEQAFALAQQAIARDDSLPEAHAILGYVYALRQQYEQAIAEGERALALAPNHADVYVWLAEILNFAGRPKKAVGLVQQAMRLNPHFSEFYLLQLGWAYCMAGQYAEAIATLERGLIRNPDHLSLSVNLAASYLSQWVGQWSQDPQTLERAVEAAQRAVALSDTTFWSHSVLSAVYLWQKRHAEAVAEAERAVVLNPNDAVGPASLGAVLNYAGRPAETIEMLEPTSCLSSFISEGSAVCFLVLGQAYSLTGRSEEAISPLNTVLSYPIQAQHLKAHLYLAANYQELGRKEEAQAEVAAMLQVNPNFSLEVWKQRVPYTDPAVTERLSAVLRKAGLK